MKKTFKTLKTDAGKLSVELLHEYRPLKDHPDVVVELEHIRNGEIMNFMDMESRELSYPKMFLHKVKAVHGVDIEDAQGNVVEATKEDIVNISDPDFLAIVMATCAHLVGGAALTEDEAKN